MLPKGLLLVPCGVVVWWCEFEDMWERSSLVTCLEEIPFHRCRSATVLWESLLSSLPTWTPCDLGFQPTLEALTRFVTSRNSSHLLFLILPNFFLSFKCYLPFAHNCRPAVGSLPSKLFCHLRGLTPPFLRSWDAPKPILPTELNYRFIDSRVDRQFSGCISERHRLIFLADIYKYTFKEIQCVPQDSHFMIGAGYFYGFWGCLRDGWFKMCSLTVCKITHLVGFVRMQTTCRWAMLPINAAASCWWRLAWGNMVYRWKAAVYS